MFSAGTHTPRLISAPASARHLAMAQPKPCSSAAPRGVRAARTANLAVLRDGPTARSGCATLPACPAGACMLAACFQGIGKASLQSQDPEHTIRHAYLVVSNAGDERLLACGDGAAGLAISN